MISALSGQQVVTAVELRKLWSELPSRMEPLDRATAGAVVKPFYRVMKRGEPKIKGCDSPHGILLVGADSVVPNGEPPISSAP